MVRSSFRNLALSAVLLGFTSACSSSANGSPSSAESAASAPVYSEEELTRLELCPLISTTVMLAANAKLKGTPEEEFRARQQYTDEALGKMSEAFISQTYRDDFSDPVAYVVENQRQCVSRVAELPDDRSALARECLGRHFMTAVIVGSPSDVSLEEQQGLLRNVPGYSAQFVEAEFKRRHESGEAPSLETWRDCVRGKG